LINLGDCVVTSEDVDHLVKDCWREGKPRPISEVARVYLAHRIESEHGFLPYDRRRAYKEKDRIVFCLKEKWEPAEVIRVSKGALRDPDVFSADEIRVRWLRQDAMLRGVETKDFIADYHGEHWAGEEIRSYEMVTERDEWEVIPKLLVALETDKRFIEFDSQWLPRDLLTIEVSNRLNEAVAIVGTHGGGIRTTELLEELHVEGIREESRSRAEFTLNYFLEKEKTLARKESDGEIAWEVRVKRTCGEECSVTVRSEWLERGVLVVPLSLARRIANADVVHIRCAGGDEEVPYEEQIRTMRGLAGFYRKKALAEGDKVHIRVENGDFSRLFVYTRWVPSLHRLLKLQPADLAWENAPLRNCIIVVLARLKMPLHHREIYAEIALHKRASSGSVIATLSHYSPSVFVHVEQGKWQLAGVAQPKGQNDLHPEKVVEIRQPSEDTWKAVENIEDKDYVYKLLQEAKRPLSFDEMCSKLSSYLGIDVDELRATGFLRGDDERLKRLDDGTWALAEWFRASKPEPERNRELLWVGVVVVGLVVGGIAVVVNLIGVATVMYLILKGW
jgi:DNA-directed RNA polymerase delta subunit